MSTKRVVYAEPQSQMSSESGAIIKGLSFLFRAAVRAAVPAVPVYAALSTNSFSDIAVWSATAVTALIGNAIGEYELTRVRGLLTSSFMADGDHADGYQRILPSRLNESKKLPIRDEQPISSTSVDLLRTYVYSSEDVQPLSNDKDYNAVVAKVNSVGQELHNLMVEERYLEQEMFDVNKSMSTSRRELLAFDSWSNDRIAELKKEYDYKSAQLDEYEERYKIRQPLDSQEESLQVEVESERPSEQDVLLDQQEEIRQMWQDAYDRRETLLDDLDRMQDGSNFYADQPSERQKAERRLKIDEVSDSILELDRHIEGLTIQYDAIDQKIASSSIAELGTDQQEDNGEHVSDGPVNSVSSTVITLEGMNVETDGFVAPYEQPVSVNGGGGAHVFHQRLDMS